MSINARSKGIQYEIHIMNELKEFFPNCATSRNVSKDMDDLKVDLVNTGDFHFQLKAWERNPVYHDLLKEMPRGKNVIIHKRNRKGSIAVMDLNLFYLLLEKYLCVYTDQKQETT